MKTFSFLILLTVLFVADYALAQSCPCDTLELANGTTGNDIIEILCPGGSPGEGTVYTVNSDSAGVVSESFSYAAALNEAVCEIGEAKVQSDFLPLTDQEFESCKARLAAACGPVRNPIPTLGEWGMIAMAGVLGIIGLIVTARRRKAAA